MVGSTENVSDHACINKHCKLYNKKNKGNLIVKTWIGHNKDIRLLYCIECKYHFSENYDTFDFV